MRPAWRPWIETGAALAAGAIAVTGFAPLNLSAALLLALVAQFCLWRSATPAAAARLGFAFGLGFFGAGVSWVYISMQRFGGMAPLLAATLAFAFCAGMACFYAAAGYLQARVPAPAAARAVVLAPACWALLEWSRAWFLTGFPWLAFGHAAIDIAPLAAYAPIGGVYLITLLLLLLAASVAAALPRAGASVVGPAVPSVLFALVLLLGFALRGIEWSKPNAAPVRVSLLQGNIEQDLKWRPDKFANNLKTYAQQVAASQGRLIVLPETAVPAVFDALPPSFVETLRQSVHTRGADILIGVFERDPGGAFYNSVVSLGASPSQSYQKQHLVPFGEFIPPGFSWFLDLMQIPMSNLARGDVQQPPLAVAGEQVAVNICYEDVFGAELRRGTANATILVNASNVAWFGESLAPAQHLQMARMRALENARPMLRATNTGVTAAIDASGSVIAALPSFTSGVLEVSVHGRRGVTPYMRLGDSLAAGLALALVLAAVAAGRVLRR